VLSSEALNRTPTFCRLPGKLPQLLNNFAKTTSRWIRTVQSCWNSPHLVKCQRHKLTKFDPHCKVPLFSRPVHSEPHQGGLGSTFTITVAEALGVGLLRSSKRTTGRRQIVVRNSGSYESLSVLLRTQDSGRYSPPLSDEVRRRWGRIHHGGGPVLYSLGSGSSCEPTARHIGLISLRPPGPQEKFSRKG
jgi:hypothetical protein